MSRSYATQSKGQQVFSPTKNKTLQNRFVFFQYTAQKRKGIFNIDFD